MNLLLYPKELQDEIIKNKNFIPRKLRHHERFKQYHKYYNDEFGIFKVRNVEYIDGNEYYFITYKKDMTAAIPFPIYNNNKCYELMLNKDEIENKSIINNRSTTFFGAEIKFWFIVNNINFSDENYIGFKDDLNFIYDSKKYHVRRNKKLKEYEFLAE